MLRLALVAASLHIFAFSPHSAYGEKRSETNTIFCEKDWDDVELCTAISEDNISDPCLDSNEQCAYWASIDECKKNPNYMLSNCARSCDQCPSFFNTHEKISGLCTDYKEECNQWAKLGECTKNPSYMSANCARSCKKCPSMNQSSKSKSKNTDTGVPQTFEGMNEAEKKTTKAQINAMKKYASLYINHPDATSKSLGLCKNQLDKCAYYASKGLCEKRVVFMMDNCPLACKMCDKAQQFGECVGMREPHSLPVFISENEYDLIKNNDFNDSFITDQVQTIDLFFHSKRENKDWTMFGAEYVLDSANKLNNDDQNDDNGGGSWMVRFGNFLTPEECKAIINLGHTIGLEESNNKMPLHEKSKEQKPTSSFKNAKCSHSLELCNDHSVLSSIKERVTKILSISQDYFEPVEIVLYPGSSSGFHSLHHDYDIHDNWKLAGPRVLSLYITLSDVEAGGYLGFPVIDWLMIPPRAGQMVMWPNVLSREPMTVDEKMAKEILPPRQGDLYVLHVRIHQYNYTSARLRGCV